MPPAIKYKPQRFSDLADKNDEILHAITLPKPNTPDIPKVPEPDYVEMTYSGPPPLLPTEDKIIYTEVEIVTDGTSNYKPQAPREKSDYVEIDFERTKLLNPLFFKCPDNSGLRRTRHDRTFSDE